jgi:ABC-type phosphate/phosphonate transport system ATPase subunit
MSFIELSNVEKSFGKTKVLHDLNLQIVAQEHVAIRGASGSGKSTLANQLGGSLVEADRYFMVYGEYKFDASKLISESFLTPIINGFTSSIDMYSVILVLNCLAL